MTTRAEPTKRAQQIKQKREDAIWGAAMAASVMRSGVKEIDRPIVAGVFAAIEPTDVTEWIRSLRSAIRDLEHVREQLRASRRYARPRSTRSRVAAS